MAAQFKREVQEVIGWDIKQALTKGTLKPIQKPCEIYIEYYEKTKRRDCDNIMGGGNKFILDTLVEMQIIPNDSRKWVKQVHCTVKDGVEDCVIVEIRESRETQ